MLPVKSNLSNSIFGLLSVFYNDLARGWLSIISANPVNASGASSFLFLPSFW
jgi:hypothetical protein